MSKARSVNRVAVQSEAPLWAGSSTSGPASSEIPTPPAATSSYTMVSPTARLHPQSSKITPTDGLFGDAGRRSEQSSAVETGPHVDGKRITFCKAGFCVMAAAPTARGVQRANSGAFETSDEFKAPSRTPGSLGIVVRSTGASSVPHFHRHLSENPGNDYPADAARSKYSSAVGTPRSGARKTKTTSFRAISLGVMGLTSTLRRVHSADSIAS